MEHNTQISEKSLVYASDPREKAAPPTTLDDVPYFNFAPLQNAVALLKEKAAQYTAKAAGGAGAAVRLTEAKRKALDAVLMGMEQRLTLKKRLAGRPWYVHQVYAPGAYTGYGVKTLPGVREALESRKWSDVDREIVSVAGVLGNYTAGIGEAVKLLSE